MTDLDFKNLEWHVTLKFSWWQRSFTRCLSKSKQKYTRAGDDVMTCSAIDCPLAQQPDQSCPSSPPQQRLAQGTSACLNSSKRRVLGSSVGLGELNWSLGDRLQLSSKFTRFTGTAPHFTCGQVFRSLYTHIHRIRRFLNSMYIWLCLLPKRVLVCESGAGTLKKASISYLTHPMVGSITRNGIMGVLIIKSCHRNSAAHLKN